jgi:uncharacterized membrane protein
MSKESFRFNKILSTKSKFQGYLTTEVLLGIILLLGVGLRFYELGAKSYWNDEMYSLIEGQQSIFQLIMSGKLDQPLAYYIPFHLWLQIFGVAEVSTRAFSVLAGIGSIILIYLIGRELFGKPVGLLGAFLMAITEFQIHYSQITRFYSYFEFMALLSYLYFILALKDKKNIHFAFYVIASILLVYSHIYGAFILAAQNLFLVLQLKKYKNILPAWFICQALVLIALLPNLYLLFFGGAGLGGAIAENTWGLPKPSLLILLKTFFYFIFSPRRDRSWDAMLSNYAIAGSLLLIGILISFIRQGKRTVVTNVREVIANLQETPVVALNLFLVCCWLLIPVLLPFIFSLVVSPIYAERYLISAAPALYLLLSVGIFNIRKLVPLIVSLIVLVVMIVPGLGYYYVTPVDEQWREVAMYVEKYSETNDVIVFAPIVRIGMAEIAFRWYYRGALPTCGLSDKLTDTDTISDALVECTSGHNRFWAIIADDRGEPSSLRYNLFFQDPKPMGAQLIRSYKFIRTSVYLFELAK